MPRVQAKRDQLSGELGSGFHLETRVYDTFDCTWVVTYDFWYRAVMKHTAKRDFTTDHVATFETLDSWEKNFSEGGKKPVFCMLMEPYNRWLEGLRYWLTNYTLSAADKQLWSVKRDSPIFFEKLGWPRMDNHTKTISECIAGIKIDAFIVCDNNMDQKFWDFCKTYKLSYDLTKRITDSHQLIYDPQGTEKYRKEMNEYAQWLNDHEMYRDKVIQHYLKDDFNLWYKHKQF